MFDATSIPVLEQVVNYTQARHGVLAGNIANLDTPGYRAADLSPERFEDKLRDAITARAEEKSGFSLGQMTAEKYDPLHELSDDSHSILYHDDSEVSIEQQVAKLSKNQGNHNLALTIMVSQFRLLETAIREQVIG